MSPSAFWALHPTEFWWLAEAYREKVEMQNSKRPTIAEEDAAEMLDELKQARAAAGVK